MNIDFEQLRQDAADNITQQTMYMSIDDKPHKFEEQAEERNFLLFSVHEIIKYAQDNDIEGQMADLIVDFYENYVDGHYE